MIYGDPQRFAIEFAVCEEDLDEWIDGYSCYWISGQRVGNFELFDSLRDALFEWVDMTWRKDRTNLELSGMGTQELLETIRSGLYYTGLPGNELDVQRADEGRWDRHNINPWTAVFVGWYIFLVDDGRSARCVYAWGEDSPMVAQEQQLNLGEFDQILDDTVAYLAVIHRRFGGSVILPPHLTVKRHSINPKHVQRSGHFSPGARVLPGDAKEAYAAAVKEYGTEGTWWALGKEGWYRYFSDNAGGAHYSGTFPWKYAPQYIVRGWRK